ncbi:TLDc domain-containing protein [Haematococcus lacustris]|uniref:TLDc domain-containing protein n=1 Tax=Haematococcus lacustris TaxID=44745 RepID=A0A699ZAF3_HAELA|nr:TLDc domain-containing protein [Haematococcus lacustris]
MPLPRHVLGGFAPAPWAKSGTFFGDHSAFVFRLEPELQVFNATGINTNFQWCGVGNSQLVNGLGFGGAQGAAGQFGLLLDVSMDRGMSRPIATFGSPCLASQQLFQVGVVEAWLLQAPEEEDVPATTTNGTVMDRMASDRAFMSLAGVGTDHSAGLRQQRPEDDL